MYRGHVHTKSCVLQNIELLKPTKFWDLFQYKISIYIYIQNSNIFTWKDTIILFIAVEIHQNDVINSHGIAWFYENKVIYVEYLVKDIKS